MARMYPERLPAWVLEDPRLSAERKVYEKLRADLPRAYTVFYGVAWHGRDPGGRLREGEADFVIAHPERGLLVLEIKGGGISHDGATGRWFSEDRSGVRHEIQDPYRQAKISRMALLEKVREIPALRGRWIPIWQGVVLPDVPLPEEPLALDGPLEITAFFEDMARLAERVEEIFAYWAREPRGEALGGDGVEAVVDLLAPTFDLREPLAAVLQEEEREIRQLTEEQFRVLDLCSRLRRVAVSGGAGTGKTLLALEQARRLARQGLRALLTCFNEPLAEHLRRAAGGLSGLEVCHFHGLCVSLAKEAGIELGEAEQGREAQFFDELLPQALLDALEKLPRARFDALIVDEGQDFRPEWWTPLELSLADHKEGLLFVFHDDNQRIYREAAGFPEGLAPISLTRNFRNPRPVHALARKFYSGGTLEGAGPAGRPVEFVEAPGADRTEERLAETLRRLVRTERILPERIAVLTGRGRERSRLYRRERIGGFQTTHIPAGEKGKVLVETIWRFKGLEREVVILVEAEEAREREKLLYVGLTRATGHLVVVGPAELIEFLSGDPRG